MEKTPSGTAVGVDDPYEHAGVCDHLTGDGTCRFAFEHPEQDPAFARERREEAFACPVASPEADGDWEFPDCPHFRSRSTSRECARCGLSERRVAHEDARPLLEEHHLSYAGGGSREAGERAREAADTLDHEITVVLCRWCHAKVHDSWARITDAASPDPEALAEGEGRRSRELDEAEFRSARDRLE